MRAEYDYYGPVYDRPSINVHPLKENKRPIGFARDWPEPKPARKQPAKRKPKK